MESKRERLERYWRAKGFKNESKFAKALSLHQDHISKIDSKSSSGKLGEVLANECPDLNLTWLLTGEGEMFVNPDRPSAAFDVPPPSRRIPIISWAQAGPDGFFLDSFPSGSGFGDINCPYDITDPNAYALTIIGDSMIPKYEPGDVILVSPNMGVQTGDYAVVRLKDGTVAAKRIKARDTLYILESINPEYPPVECQKEDVIFMHRIVWVKQRG